MNLFELFVKIGVKDEASDNVSKLSEKLGNGLKTAAKIGTAAVTAAATGIVALTKSAVSNYAEYEQLVGGVETLFKDSSEKVMKYANNAYKTAGMSANDYMDTVTGFSASLLDSLEKDTEAAAEYADKAISDMSDNANKMGTDIGLIQSAYQGFAKQNYTMLDNLKLGYGGTKTEMERLIARANELKEVNGETANLTIESYADIIEAIHVVQDEMDITGTTAKEAGTTIQGSISSMKSAWTNLITGLADGNADVKTLVDDLVTTIVGDGTETNLGVFGNVLPAVKTALGGISTLIGEVVPVIIAEVPSILDENLPILLNAAVTVISKLAGELPSICSTLVDVIVNDVFPNIVSALGELDLASGILDLIPTIVGAVLQIATTLTNPETIENFAGAGIELLNGLLSGIQSAIPLLVGQIPVIIQNLVTVLTTNIPTIIQSACSMLTESLPVLIEGAISLVDGVVTALPEIITSLLDMLPDLITMIVDVIVDNLPILISGIVQLVSILVTQLPEICMAIAAALPEIMTSIVLGIVDLAGALIEGAHQLVWELIKALPEICASLIEAVVGYWGDMWEAIKGVFSSVGTWFSEKFQEGNENAKNAWSNVKNEFGEIWGNIKSAFSELAGFFSEKFEEGKENARAAWDDAKERFGEVWEKIKEAFDVGNALQWGKDMIDNFKKGILERWEALKSTVKSVAQSVKDFLGFSEPKEGPLSNFHTYAPDMMELFAKGIRENEDVVINQVKRSFDLGKYIGTIAPTDSATMHINSAGIANGQSVSVVQNIYSTAKTAADLMQEAIYQQERAVIFGV